MNFGIVRLQTANLRFDWENTSVVAGQDSLFISPLSPTSFASLATPAFAFAGNLWGWTPQLRVEHRFSLSDQQTVTVQAGMLDNLDWEYPPNSFYRWAQAGEMSGQPAYAVRTAWSRPVREHPLSLGVAGYYGRQDWTWGRNVDAWAAMADWQIPILPRLGLSGEFYRGRGIGGLGGAIGTSIVYGGDPNLPFTPIRGVDTAGGWSQLKFQLTPKIELNGVFAEDDAFTGNIRGFATDQNNFGEIIGRNRGALGNVVFRPRSDLVLSAEFRRLRTFPVYSSSSITQSGESIRGDLVLKTRSIHCGMLVFAVLAVVVCAPAQQALRGHVQLTRNGHSVTNASKAVVWLTPIGATVEPPRQDPSQIPQLVQKNKSFQPSLLVIPVGGKVEFPNHDPFFHNVFSLFEGKRFDLGLYESGTTRFVQFDKPGSLFHLLQHSRADERRGHRPGDALLRHFGCAGGRQHFQRSTRPLSSCRCFTLRSRPTRCAP